jgi:hypothetical protein
MAPEGVFFNRFSVTGPRLMLRLSSFSRRLAFDLLFSDTATRVLETSDQSRLSGSKNRNQFLRKEVIQPQVPLRLPCYDLVPITEFILGACVLAVRTATWDAPRFRGLTGGVYKAQEHIHRSIADLRLLAIPASCRRVAACNPN